jgi:Flp pilus assembly protein TadG
MTRFGSRRGVAMIEGALVFLVFSILLAGTMELGVVGFAGNAVTFAAHRAARFAAVRGSTSGHAATLADIQASALANASPLDPANLTVSVAWLPDNSPGSSVEVTLVYALRPALLPLANHALRLQSNARERITQ